jgi:hypothetical protein
MGECGSGSHSAMRGGAQIFFPQGVACVFAVRGWVKRSRCNASPYVGLTCAEGGVDGPEGGFILWLKAGLRTWMSAALEESGML